MVENIHKLALVIERVRTDQSRIGKEMPREAVATLPIVSGEFIVDGKPLVLTVCPPDTTQRQKVIFEGSHFPTINQRGKSSQFTKDSGKRRVVSFPVGRHNVSVTQTVGPSEYLVFRRIGIQRKGGDVT